MRTLGTYGGHLELSAFAHATLKSIRIVQPGLMYVVACDDNSASARAARNRRERARAKALAHGPREATRGARRTRCAPLECVGPLHLAYVFLTHTATTVGNTTARCAASRGRTRATPASPRQRRMTRTLSASCTAACRDTRRARCACSYGAWATGRPSSKSCCAATRSATHAPRPRHHRPSRPRRRHRLYRHPGPRRAHANAYVRRSGTVRWTRPIPPSSGS